MIRKGNDASDFQVAWEEAIATTPESTVLTVNKGTFWRAEVDSQKRVTLSAPGVACARTSKPINWLPGTIYASLYGISLASYDNRVEDFVVTHDGESYTLTPEYQAVAYVVQNTNWPTDLGEWFEYNADEIENPSTGILVFPNVELDTYPETYPFETDGEARAVIVSPSGYQDTVAGYGVFWMIMDVSALLEYKES